MPEEASVFDLEISGEEEEEEIIAYASERPLPELEGKWGAYGMKSMARGTMEHGYASGEIKKASGTIVAKRK